jgi:hypothetical protein
MKWGLQVGKRPTRILQTPEWECGCSSRADGFALDLVEPIDGGIVGYNNVSCPDQGGG